MASTFPAGSQLPTGTVTFLFTDIEESTVLWERDAAAMQVALAQHDTLLQQAIQSSLGSIVKTTGDGVIAVFRTAMNALEASIAAQRALRAAHAAVSNPDPVRY